MKREIQRKKCTQCGKLRPLDTGYHRSKTSPDGKQDRCMVCGRSKQVVSVERAVEYSRKVDALGEDKIAIAELNKQYFGGKK